MTESEANMVAMGLHGQARQTGGGIWLVTITTCDNRLVVISEDRICEYRDEAAFDAGEAITSIERD